MHFKSKITRAAAAVLIAVMLAMSIAGCSLTGNTADAGTSGGSKTVADTGDITVEDLASMEMFTDRDLSGEYDAEEASKVELGDEDYTITKEGTYILSGSLKGQVTVDADDAKVQIVLDGVSISNESSAAIYVKSAKKVFITLADGSENTLKVTGKYEAIDDNNIDAVIYSKEDLTINGTGSLTVTGKYGHGVTSKDDLVITGGTITVSAEKKALDANNSVRIADGVLELTAGTDGIHASDTDKSVGFIYIKDGSVTISAGDDGVHADTDFVMDGGRITVSKAYEGLEGNTVIINGGTVKVTASDDGINAAGGSDTGTSDTGNSDTDKSEHGGGDMFVSDDSAIIQINGGNVKVNADGDGIDSNGSLEINGGDTVVEGPENDGNGSIDIGEGGDSTATVNGGTFIATGSSGMAVNFDESSKQCAILATVDSSTGSVILKNSEGLVMAETDTDKNYTCVLISTPDIEKDGNYKLITGEGNSKTTTKIEMDGTIYGEARGTGGHGGFDRQGGQGGPGNGGTPPSGERPDGEKPDGAPGQESDSSSDSSGTWGCGQKPGL